MTVPTLKLKSAVINTTSRTLLLLSVTMIAVSGCTSLQSLYESEVSAEITKHPPSSQGVFTENDIAVLPTPVQNYFRHCGFMGKPKMTNVRVFWNNVSFKRAKDKEWLPLECYQFNSVPEPTRIVFMTSRLAGFIPFEGRDKYQDGYGNMYIKLIKGITIANEKSRFMNSSALVTVLAETFIAPTYALQPYIKWQSIDSVSAKATATFGGTTVAGIFYFTPEGELARFDTFDRYQGEADSTNIPWSARMGSYVEKAGIRFPTEMSAAWYEKDGTYEYFRGNIIDLKFDVQE